MATSLDPSAIFSQLTEGYIKLPLVQKIVFPLLVAGSVAGILFVSKWANRPDFTVLYSDLAPADSAAVVEKLKSLKIKYEVRGDGTTIAVSPPDMVHELRLSMASEGIPKGGTVGLEIFQGVSLGVTSSQEKTMLQRAIQGELERTITALEAVSAARVHTTQPEATVFARQGSKATASVMLKLKPGAKLEKKQIKGIANLVAGAVPRLQSEDVTIVDVQGNLLTPRENEQEALGVEAQRLQYQREVEQSYIGRIEQMLTKVIGAEKIIARVTAELDFSSLEREEESYDPGGQVLRSERSVEEGVGSAQRGGVPGVVSNLTNDPNLLAAPGGTKEASTRKEAIKNYEVTRAISKTSAPRGTLKRLSVAVLVDGTYELPAGAAPDAPKVFKALEPETLGRIESVVKSAVGFDTARGDTITVENIPFVTSELDFTKEMEKEAWWKKVYGAIWWGGPILFVLLFFWIVMRPLVKFLATPTEAEVDLSRLLPTGIEELERELDAERAKANIPEAESKIDMDQLEELMSENSRIVKENPHQAALLIRYWLNDGRM